jgi:PAS domain S-box-containing protein
MVQKTDQEKTREELLQELAALRRRLSTDSTPPRLDHLVCREELARAEQALQQRKEQLRILFEKSPLGMIVVDPATLQILKFNEQVLVLSGYSREEFAQLTVHDFEANFTAEELAIMGQRLREQGWHQFETRIRTKHGQLHDIQLTGQVVQEGGRPYLLQILEDISARKIMERELIQAKNQAEEASRAKSEFLASMSHEIRTPLTVVIGAIDLLLQTAAEPEQQTLLGMSSEAASRLHALIEDILDLARIEARRLEIRREDFGLRDSVGNTIELFRLQALQKGLQLRWEIDPAVPDLIHGDPDRLAQVLINLIGNAVKFTAHGAVTVRVIQQQQDLLFAVHDTGIGIAASDQHRLFQSFCQLDSSLTRKYGGTGLGLAISKALVELMGGCIWVESVAGEGSTFFFTIPALAEAGAPAPAPPADDRYPQSMIRR